MPLSYSLSEIDQAAQYVLEQLGANRFVALRATMGSGKTSLMTAIAAQLKCSDIVSSPTYSIINEYKCNDQSIIVHMDWYRLNSVDEALEAGVQDYIDSSLCFVEWPEKCEALVPKTYLNVEIKVTDTEERIISVQSVSV